MKSKVDASLSLAEKAAFLADTADELLPAFSPMDRAVIIALKKIRKKSEAAERLRKIKPKKTGGIP